MSPAAPKQAWIDVIGLDQTGVNRSDDDLALKPADLRVAQNVAFTWRHWGTMSPQPGLLSVRGGLTSRQGIRAVTSTACAGAIYAIAGFTFTDPSPDAILTDDDLATVWDDALMTLVE